MSGYALVIGDRLIVDETSLPKVGNRYDYAARPLAVRCPRLIVRGIAGLEVRHRLDGDRRPWHEFEQLGQLRFHLGNVVAEIVHDLARGRGAIFRVLLEGRAEGRQVVEALVARDREHFALDPLDLAQADLMNLVRG